MGRFQKTGTFGFGTRRAADGTTLLAFRGTQFDDLRDLLTDLRFPLADWPEGTGPVHGGFAHAARSVLPAVQGWLTRANAGSGPLVLTGHSLGAAIATLMATVLRPELLVTLGSPRVGDDAFCGSLRRIAGLRLVDCADIVTRLPLPQMGYVHIRPPTYVTRGGNVLDEPTESTIESDLFMAKLVYALRHAWLPGNVALRSFADHAPINYLRGYFR